MDERLQVATVWGLLEGNGLTGLRVRLWRWLMLGWAVTLDCQRCMVSSPVDLWNGWRVRLPGLRLTLALSLLAMLQRLM